MNDHTEPPLPLELEGLRLASDEPEARQRFDRIRQGLTAYADLIADIIDAYDRRDWVSLGYADWDDYCTAVRDGISLPRAERPVFVRELTEAGMSTRAIAAAIGVSHQTVANVRDASTVKDLTVDDPSPRTVLSLDGKTRTYPREQPAPEPEFDAGAALERYLAGEPSIRDANLRADFSRWLYRISRAHLFDPEEMARIAPDELDSLRRLRTNFENWCDAYEAAATPKPGLRIIEGEAE